ncbi:efflux RND transporter permease subunit, partial [Salmonella enterica]|uniref:efflux RND transporter permease subunit n=1 Tax=Salmonella enterica TaxID=28901 RepID=UPI00398C63C5
RVIHNDTEQGTAPVMSPIQGQHRGRGAMPCRPEEVQRVGCVTEKASPGLLMVVHLVSPHKRYDSLYLSNFAIRQVRDELARLPGVGDVLVWCPGQAALPLLLEPPQIPPPRLPPLVCCAALRDTAVKVS